MAMILAGAALLGYGDADERRAGQAVREACLETVSAGIRTSDLGGGAGTTDFTNAVVERVRARLATAGETQ
jgi:isocitrate/isopropylmalate dehydrogenase